MSYLHEKSLCCRGLVIHYGQRRRQCTNCQSSWRVWRRKRGRKRHRTSFTALINFLDNRDGPLSSQAGRRGLLPGAYRARLRQDLNRFIQQTPWPSIPPGALIAIADALEQTIKGQIWTIYFILLRSVNSKHAFIAMPLVRLGREHQTGGWQSAFDQLSPEAKNRIKALVCDGARGLVAIAKQGDWILQRCHFHLRHRIANYIRSGPLSKQSAVGLDIKKLVDTILLEPDELAVKSAIKQLQLVSTNIRSRFLKTILSGLARYYRDYRSYLAHPELRLPNTSNSVESLNSLIRDLQRRARGFSSLKSFLSWLVALCKRRRSVICNKKYQPN